LQVSSADIPVAAAVVEKPDTAEEEETNVSPVCPNALETSKEEGDLTRGEADDNNNYHLRPTSFI